MAGFSEAAMMKRLDTLTMTTQSIQTLSMWLIHHQKHNADNIVHFWLKAVKREIRAARLVNLLYLANDVIQNSRRQCPNFMANFYTVLEPAFKHVSMHADSQSVVALKKIVRVFRERQIYAMPKIDRLCSAVTATLTGVRLVEFNVDLGGNPGEIFSSKHQMAPTTPPHSGKLATDSPSTSTPADESPERKKSRVENFDYKAMEQTGKDLLAVLKKLEDPPSADADTRQMIASFPETIANPSLLKPIKRETEARLLKQKIDEAQPVVNSYCERLVEEMNERRNVRTLMNDYIGFLKDDVMRNEELLQSVKEKREKLNIVREGAVKHLEALPDLDDIPADALNPLPSLSELFKNASTNSKAA